MQGYGGDKIFRTFIDETCTSHSISSTGELSWIIELPLVSRDS